MCNRDDHKTTDQTATQKKPGSPLCFECDSPLTPGGQKYGPMCLTCNPEYARRCSDVGCGRPLWSCQCINPHSWE